MIGFDWVWVEINNSFKTLGNFTVSYKNYLLLQVCFGYFICLRFNVHRFEYIKNSHIFDFNKWYLYFIEARTTPCRSVSVSDNEKAFDSIGRWLAKISGNFEDRQRGFDGNRHPGFCSRSYSYHQGKVIKFVFLFFIHFLSSEAQR